MKNKINNKLVGFITCWSMIIGVIYSARAQETKSAATSAVASPSSQQDAKIIAASDATPAEESKASFSNVESNTNGIVPTDPSMIPPPESTPADNGTNAPLPMDPNAASATEMTTQERSPVNSTESIEKKKHEIKVRYNEVRTQVEKEESVAALRQAADKATTPEGQRQALKAYYELLFKRMKQIDSSLSERCDVMQGAYLRRIEQNGVEPTIPLSLPSNGATNSTNASTLPATKKKIHKDRSDKKDKEN